MDTQLCSDARRIQFAAMQRTHEINFFAWAEAGAENVDVSL
jgi:hypothetical protein